MTCFGQRRASAAIFIYIIIFGVILDMASRLDRSAGPSEKREDSNNRSA